MSMWTKFLGNVVFLLLRVDISKFTLGIMNMGCDLLLHLGAYLKVILNQICGENVQIRKHIMIAVSIKKP